VCQMANCSYLSFLIERMNKTGAEKLTSPMLRVSTQTIEQGFGQRRRQGERCDWLIVTQWLASYNGPSDRDPTKT
jgi:hypothetical protein